MASPAAASPALVTLQPPSRPSEPGLDIIVIHGVRTYSLPPLPTTWSQALAKLAPDNTKILSYDADLIVDKTFVWREFEQRSAGLLDAIIQEYRASMWASTRIQLFIGYALAGAIFKNTLLEFSQRADYEHLIRQTRGLIFLATPHFTDTLPSSNRQLAAIIRYETHNTKQLIPPIDLQAFVTCSRRFAELNLTCPILSCSEQVEVKAKAMGFSRRVQRVDEQLAKTSAVREKLVQIDCTLESLFHSTTCAIHTIVLDFMASVLKQNEREALPRALAKKSSLSTSSNSSSCISTPVTAGSSPEIHRAYPRDRLLASDSSTLDKQALSLDASSTPSTPRNISTSSDESCVLILRANDFHVPNSVVYVQNPLYERANDDFQGQAECLLKMDTSLRPPTAVQGEVRLPRTCVLCGPPGIGKTQTALQYFHTRKAHFDVVLWVQANNSESLLAAFAQISIRLGLQKPNNPKHEPDYSPKQVVDWLRDPVQESWKSNPRRMKWLLVFDNVNDDRVLVDFWPSHAPGSIIITTRDPVVRDTRDSARNGVLLPALSVPESVTLLRRRLPQRLWQDESQEVLIRVVKTLACWPLAIVQMAGKMHRLSQTPSRFLRNYEKETKRVKYYEQAENDQDGYGAALATLWSLDNPESASARLLSVMSLLLPESIPDFVLEDAKDHAGLTGYPLADDYDWAMSELEKASTISRTTSSKVGEVTIHSLIQEVVRSQLLKNEARFIEVFNATVRLLMAVWDHQTLPTTRHRELAKTSRWEHCNRILPHLGQIRIMYELLSPAGRRGCVTDEFLNMLNEVGWHHFLQRNLDEALEYVHTTLDILETCPPNSHPSIQAGQYATWAAVALHLNQPTLAREKYRECFRINQEIFAAGPAVITGQYVAAYTELGRILIATNDLDEAAELINESERLRRQMPHFSRLQLFSPILFYSHIELIRGEYAAAEQHLLEALRDRQMHYGLDDHESKRAGHLLYALGTVVTLARRFRDGRAYHQRAYEALRAAGGETDIDAARACYKLATHYVRDGSFLTACIAIERAVNAFARSKYYKAELSRALFVKSNIVRELGEVGEAREVLSQSVDLWQQLVQGGPRAPETLKEDDFDRLLVPWLR